MSLEAELSLGKLQNMRICARGGGSQAGNVICCSTDKDAVCTSKARSPEVKRIRKGCGS